MAFELNPFDGDLNPFNSPDKAGRTLKRSLDKTSALRGRFKERADELEGQDLTGTARYQQGQAALRRMLERQRDQDAAAAAKRGLTGSEYEIAQASERQDTRAQGQRKLLTDSERFLEDRRRRALGRLLESQGLYNQAAGTRAQQQQREQESFERMLSTVVGGAGKVASSYFGSSGG
jgi:hypothetical protein